MKWNKETQTYCWAHYYSEDGNWKVWDEDKVIPQGNKRMKVLDRKTGKMVYADALKHIWKLQNIKTGETLENEFKTLKEAKTFAEQQ